MAGADLTATVDPRGVVTGWSDGARRLTGYAAEEVVGRHAGDLLAEPPPAGQGPTALDGAVALRHRDGHTIELTMRSCPVLDGDGRPQSFVVTAAAPEQRASAVGEEVFRQASIPMSAHDTRQRYLAVNDTGCRVAGVGEEALLGRSLQDRLSERADVQDFIEQLREVARTGKPSRYKSLARTTGELYDHAWDVEMWPLRDGSGEVYGVGLAAFDNSEQYWARQRLALLNEAAATIGTTLDVARTAEELVELVVPRFADFASVDLLDWMLTAEEPEAAVGRTDVVLRRAAHRSLTPGTPEAAVEVGEVDVYPPFSPPARALAEGRPVLSGSGDPAFDRWVAGHAARNERQREHGAGPHSLLAAPLRARGITLGVTVFIRALDPDPYGDDDAALAEELASRAAVCVDNARRFTRERSTALALQHSLLPRRPSGQAAVQVAHRYLPAGSLAGVGGDWFDVIPLSGSRVALVVGDVVGHGIHSSATMGRLRTAVRTLADVDLPPDELLTHLDDLVTHLADDDGGTEVAEVGATCLYAVYDPIARSLTMASAGHAPPTLLPPGGTARPVALTAGPPLGVGGLPFEAAHLRLEEGSVIALYTDGLIEGRDHDVDHGVADLSRTLTGARGSLDDMCDAILTSLLPDRPSDDVALLLARTRALGADQVATWDVPPDPSQVAVTRQHATDQLAAWGLEEAAFITELVVSELVTNAIRYGDPPIRLRLIRDRALITEVSDVNSTSPHLRRAHVYDEGGRGLMLVAQLTQRWGSRQTASGKTIWAEQPLPVG
jgi:serine phosphatase RsbU (regulator of sigma subunit)/PAS domain-containing protein/anti-sigma regulatory factor (Ser/Thr protein kinase)